MSDVLTVTPPSHPLRHSYERNYAEGVESGGERGLRGPREHRELFL